MTLDEWRTQAQVGDICRLDEGEPTPEDDWAQPMIVMRMSQDEFLFVNLKTRRSVIYSAELLYNGGMLRPSEPVTPAELVYNG